MTYNPGFTFVVITQEQCAIASLSILTLTAFFISTLKTQAVISPEISIPTYQTTRVPACIYTAFQTSHLTEVTQV